MAVSSGMQRFSISLSDDTVNTLSNVVTAMNDKSDYGVIRRSQAIARLIEESPLATGHDRSKYKLGLMVEPLEGLQIVNDYRTQKTLQDIAEHCSVATAKGLASLLASVRELNSPGEVANNDAHGMPGNE